MDLVMANDRVGQRPPLPQNEFACLLKPMLTVTGVPIVDENPIGDTARLRSLRIVRAVDQSTSARSASGRAPRRSRRAPSAALGRVAVPETVSRCVGVQIEPACGVDIDLVDAGEIVELAQPFERIVRGPARDETVDRRPGCPPLGRTLGVNGHRGDGGEGPSGSRSAVNVCARIAARLTVAVLLPTPPF